jgi:glycosyltransferase involved in cell wall biosynthesis
MRSVARELQRRHHRVQFITDRRRQVEDGSSGVRHIATWPSSRPTGWRDLVFLLGLLRRSGANVVVANFGAVNIMLIGAYLARVERRVAWYRTISGQLDLDVGTGASTAWQRLRKRLVLTLATDIVCNSHAAARDVVAVLGVPRRKVRVFHNGVAPHSTTAPVVRRGIVNVGRLDRSKGQDVLVRSLVHLPGVHATFIGDGPELPRLQALAVSEGVEAQCHFAGAKPRDEVFEAMAAAEVLVVASRSEAFGWVAIEAMACGTPVVASDTGGLSEIVRPGRDGDLFEPGDPRALADAVRRCRSRSTELGQQALERRRECFDLDTSVCAIADWLES